MEEKGVCESRRNFKGERRRPQAAGFGAPDSLVLFVFLLLPSVCMWLREGLCFACAKGPEFGREGVTKRKEAGRLLSLAGGQNLAALPGVLGLVCLLVLCPLCVCACVIACARDD